MIGRDEEEEREREGGKTERKDNKGKSQVRKNERKEGLTLGGKEWR